MGAAWRRARRAAGRRRVVDDPREGGSSATRKRLGDQRAMAAGAEAATSRRQRRPSSIDDAPVFNGTQSFMLEQASKVMSEDAARPEATGATRKQHNWHAARAIKIAMAFLLESTLVAHARRS